MPKSNNVVVGSEVKCHYKNQNGDCAYFSKEFGRTKACSKYQAKVDRVALKFYAIETGMKLTSLCHVTSPETYRRFARWHLKQIEKARKQGDELAQLRFYPSSKKRN